MISAILIIGNAGSGKSAIVWYLGSLLDEDGIKIRYVSDRLGLEKGVIEDTRNARPDSQGVRIGSHSKFIADGPPGFKKVHVLDGVILNNVHENMIKDLTKKGRDTFVLLEYAIGPDIMFGKNKKPLLQSITHVVRMLKTNHLMGSVFVIDVDAPYSVREKRELKRRDAMAAETFHSYFPDGGQMTKSDQKLLGDYCVRFYNTDEDYEWCFSEIKYRYEQFIRPKIDPKFFQKKYPKEIK
jgi:dephospho-CoA kinase